ncbi:MAG: hypothetical protein ACRDBX_08625 [Erysipelotrichaceae bacterium]
MKKKNTIKVKKQQRMSPEATIKAAREIRTYGFDIPKFGFKSAILVVTCIMATMFLPELGQLVGIASPYFTIVLGSMIVVCAVFVSQYFIEQRKNLSKLTIFGYGLLGLIVMMVYYFWIVVQLPI